MQSTHCMPRLAAITAVAFMAILSGSAHAQATIDQNKALAGNITPGDTAGFPITINQPGSYKLTSNLYVPTGTTGIAITASNVRLDLNGFSVTGPNSCSYSSSTNKVTCTGGASGTVYPLISSIASNVHVSNGSVVGSEAAGIEFSGKATSVDKVEAMHNGSFGISVTYGRVSNSTADTNRGTGIRVGEGAIFHSTATRNGGWGLLSDLVSECSATSNEGVGIYATRGVRGSLAYDNNQAYGGVQIHAGSPSMGGNMNGSKSY